MKRRVLSELLEQYDPEAEVKVLAAIVVPDDLEDASEEDQLIEDGELLEIVDERSVVAYRPNELHIVADKVFE